MTLDSLVKTDEGQTLVLTAVAISVLLLMAGLGVDVGFLRYQKQQMQKAADAGAIAGASALAYAGNYTGAARNDSAANGFTNGTNNISVAVNSPPTSGPNQTANYVEVIVSQPQPTFFMKVAGFTSVNVRARAVASAAKSADGCIYVMDPSDSQSFYVNGSVSISSACGIRINSKSGSAWVGKGGNYSVTSTTIGIVGGISPGNGTISPTPTTGISPFSDPLSSVPAPTVASGCASPSGNTYSPGTYCGGITIHGNGTYTFQPGVYTLQGGGMTVTGSPTLTGTGVLFYNTGTPSTYGGININGSATLNLSAPTTGPQAGILFFQNRAIPVGSAPSDIEGSEGAGYSGTLYFPTTDLVFRGTPSVNTYELIIAWNLEFKGNVALYSNYASLPGGVSPIHTSGLAE
jgi:hypothetical protein